MTSLNPPTNNDNAVDSDNDTQMSTQDNNTTHTTNTNNQNNNDQSNNPSINIDNAANTNNTNTNTNNNANTTTNDTQMNDNTNDDTKMNNNNNNDNNNNNNNNNNNANTIINDNTNTNNDSKMDNNDTNTNNDTTMNDNNNNNNNTNTNDNSNTNANDASNGDNDTKVNDNDNQDNDDNKDPNSSNANAPQYKYTWQWLENDGTWHDYDATTQILLDQLAIGQKISISAGKWTYDVTKVSNDSCTQVNTQTSNSRTSRRAKILIVPPAAPVTYTQNGSNNYLGNGQYVYMWQFLENDNKWKDLGFNIAIKLQQLALNTSMQYSFGKWTYTVQKTSNDECIQTNNNTNNQRDLRRILYDTNTNKRAVWEFNDDKGGWTSIGNNDLMLKLIQLPIGQITQYQRDQWIYDITKVDATHATQKNTNTNKVRQYRMVMKDKDEMDTNWSSNAQTNNQNYQAGYKNTAATATTNLQNYTFSNRFGGLFANNDVDDDKPKEIIKLDPNDIQDIIMGDDINKLMENDDNNNNNDNDDNSDNTNNKKSRNPLRALFGKNKNDSEVNDDNDEKKEDEQTKSKRVLMSEDDRNIYNEFSKTLTRDTVHIISIQKIKENASKTIVYNALLQAKKEELKNKKSVDINKIERVLFHGTSFENIAKIVNNGFNRDFNRHHLYGKGTYFSSLSSESAKYCENDDEEDNEKYVMLVCRVIIGEYTMGTRDMDGSSIPYKPDKKTQFESCVNNLHSPTIFVINRDYHAIPTHIITFKYKK